MSRDLIKKIVIGTAIALAASSPLLGQEKKPNPLNAKAEQHIILKDQQPRDPFTPPKNIRMLAKQEQNVIKSLEELTRRLEKDGIDSKQVWQAYGDNRFVIHREIINLFTGSPEAKGAKGKLTYSHYRRNLGLDDKLVKAPDFMAKYAKELAGAEKKYGVDRRYIVAIIGIESDFGNNKGHYYAFNALASIYTTRLKEFAYTELKEYLKICEKRKEGLYAHKASYAGAFTPAQFIPSSYNRLFIGKDGDFNADPYDMEDCIYSIAYYLKMNGWNPQANGKPMAEGSRNWKSILSYNRSSFYAKSVDELASKAKWQVSDLRAEPGSIADFE